MSKVTPWYDSKEQPDDLLSWCLWKSSNRADPILLSLMAKDMQLDDDLRLLDRIDWRTAVLKEKVMRLMLKEN